MTNSERPILWLFLFSIPEYYSDMRLPEGMKERTKNRHRNLFFDASHMRNFLILHTLSPCIKETFITEGGIGWLKLGCGTKKRKSLHRQGRQARAWQGRAGHDKRCRSHFEPFFTFFILFFILPCMHRVGDRKRGTSEGVGREGVR